MDKNFLSCSHIMRGDIEYIKLALNFLKKIKKLEVIFMTATGGNSTTFDGARAARWEKEVTELNAQTEQILNNIQRCIAEIKNESAGKIAEAFVHTAEGLVDKFKQLVSSVANLVSVIVDVAAKFAGFADGVVQGVKTVASLFGIHF